MKQEIYLLNLIAQRLQRMSENIFLRHYHVLALLLRTRLLTSGSMSILEETATKEMAALLIFSVKKLSWT